MQKLKLNFMEAMKLEIERLWLNLPATERDRVLVASSLARVGQAALEDKITRSIGLETLDDVIVLGIAVLAVHAEKGETVVVALAMAAKLTFILITTMPHQMGPSANNSAVMSCLVLDYLRSLFSSRRTSRVGASASTALDQVLGFSLNDGSVERNKSSEAPESNLPSSFSLFFFLCVCVLGKVETAVGSAPSLPLLAPVDSGPQNSYWRAPSSCNCVEFAIVLGALSDVSGVTLVVSPCGYSESDAPTVSILTCISVWPVIKLINLYAIYG
ncbi:putative phosphoinositide phosphatase SAC9 [Bienertia sinuspersici]